MQPDAWFIEPGFEMLDFLVKSDFQVRPSFGIADAFRVHEDDMLSIAIQEPEDEVRVEIAGLEKANSLPAPVSQDIEFPALQETRIRVVPLFQILE